MTRNKRSDIESQDLMMEAYLRHQRTIDLIPRLNLKPTVANLIGIKYEALKKALNEGEGELYVFTQPTDPNGIKKYPQALYEFSYITGRPGSTYQTPDLERDYSTPIETEDDFYNHDELRYSINLMIGKERPITINSTKTTQFTIMNKNQKLETLSVKTIESFETKQKMEEEMIYYVHKNHIQKVGQLTPYCLTQVGMALFDEPPSEYDTNTKQLEIDSRNVAFGDLANLIGQRFDIQTEGKSDLQIDVEKNRRYIVRNSELYRYKDWECHYSEQGFRVGPYGKSIVFDFDYDPFFEHNGRVYRTAFVTHDIYGEGGLTITLFSKHDFIQINLHRNDFVDSEGFITSEQIRRSLNLRFPKKIDSEEEMNRLLAGFFAAKDEFHYHRQILLLNSATQGTFLSKLIAAWTIILSRAGFNVRQDIDGGFMDIIQPQYKEVAEFWHKQTTFIVNLCVSMMTPHYTENTKSIKPPNYNPQYNDLKNRGSLPYRIYGRKLSRSEVSNFKEVQNKIKHQQYRSGHTKWQPVKNIENYPHTRWDEEKQSHYALIEVEPYWTHGVDGFVKGKSDKMVVVGQTNDSKSHGELKAVEILRKYFPNLKHNGRYDWLRNREGNKLELDIYVNENGLRFGVEIDGEQHYRPVAKFGGMEAHRKVKRNDKAKERGMKEKNIPLTRIRLSKWDLETESLLTAIRKTLPPKHQQRFDQIIQGC